jgi:phage tail sheath gpL-like
MTISFNAIPSGNRVPFTFIEFDSSKAQQGPTIQPFRGLVVGQRLSTGTVAELVKTTITSADQAGKFFGRGSMLHGMATALFLANQNFGFDFVALDDNGAGTAATGTFTFGGTATEAGTIYLYVGGQRVPVGVSSGDAAATVATNVETAMDLIDTLPATASTTTVVVTMSANHKGTLGNDIDLRANYFDGEDLPAGLTLATVAMSSGATDPTNLASVWALLGDVQYNAIAFAYRSAAELTSLEAELDDRAGPIRQIGGVAFVGARGSHATLVTLGDGRNSKWVSIIGADLSPSPTWEWAASYAGTVSKAAQADPARPFQTLELPGIIPPVETSRFTFLEQNLLLQDGISTFSVPAGATVRIQRAISTYQLSELGAPDTSYLDINTAFTLDFLRFDLGTKIRLTFPRSKLADDGTLLAAGQPIVTPSTMKAFIVGVFAGWQSLGLVEGLERFKTDLVVERNGSDPNRLDILISPDLINQLRQTAVQIGFLL